MSSPARLTYWNGRGTAEIVRLMLEICGEPWIETVYGNDESCITTFAELKVMLDDGVLCFDQVQSILNFIIILSK